MNGHDFGHDRQIARGVVCCCSLCSYLPISLSFFQNIAWALTRDVNFTRIIDDLWYRDITNVEQAYIDDFGQVRHNTSTICCQTANCERDRYMGWKEDNEIWGNFPAE